MRIQATANMGDPGVSLERLPEFTSPTGVHAYERAALTVAAGLLERCVESIEGLDRKLIADLDIECPAPPLFNAFHQPTRTYGSNAASLAKAVESGDPLKYWEEHGEMSHGHISTSDAVAETYLALGRTRGHFSKLLTSPRTLNPDIGRISKSIPQNTLKEANRILREWDTWQPGKGLDLSSAFNVPSLPKNAKVDQILERASIKDLTLIALLLIVLSHEYGHLVRHDSASFRQKMDQTAKNVLDFFMAGGPFDFGFELNRYVDLLRRDESIFAAWQEEISCDIAALDLCIQAYAAFEGDTEETESYVLNALATLCLMFSIIEVFQARKYGNIGASHPVSFVRFYLDMIYVTTGVGWNRVGRWPLMVNGIAGILSIQSRLLSK